MKKLLLSLIILVSLLAYSSLFDKTEGNQVQQAAETHISGAYEALNHEGARQTYPNSTLPKESYFAAWQQWNFGDRQAHRFVTEPWETLGPHNRAGRTLTIALNPQNENTLYAGSASGGLWRSYTGGAGKEAWEKIETGFPVLSVSDIAFHPTDSMIMYIGTGEVYNYEAAGTGAAYRNTRGSYGMGILKTEDGGNTWTKSLDWSYNQQHGVWMIKIDPNNTDILYAATTEGIYKSINAGSNWQQVLDVVMGTDILIHSENADVIVAACGNFASPEYGIYRSENGGDTWTQITSNLPAEYRGKAQLAMSLSDPDIIYASIGNGFGSDGASWLCRSEDFGSTWTVKNTEDYSLWQGWFSHDVAISPVDPDHVATIGINVWNSFDGGDSLRKISFGGVGYANPPIEGPDGNSKYVHSDAHDIIISPTNPLSYIVASDGGIHRSDDGGENWYSANGGYQTAQFYNGTSTSQNDINFYMGGLQDNGTIRLDEDLKWRRVNGGDGSWTAINPDNDSIFYVSSQNLYVRKTIDGGNNYSNLNWGETFLAPVAFIAPFVVAPSNGKVMYAGSSNLAKSTNRGDNWAKMNEGNPLDGNPILSLEVSPQDENVVYAGTAPYSGQRSHVFVTKNGSEIADITGDLPDRFPMDITVDPTDPATAYVVFSGFGTGHVFKTQNFGKAWADISGNLPDVPTNAVIVDPMFPDHIYVGNDLGVFVSTEGGGVWESYQDGLSTATMVFDLKISNPNRKLRAATHGDGAFQRDLLDASSAVVDEIQSVFDLNVFPNPVGNTVTIEFEIKTNQMVQLDLLDVNGRVVKPLLFEEINNGAHTFSFNLSVIQAGAYFIRIKNEEYQRVARLVKN